VLCLPGQARPWSAHGSRALVRRLLLHLDKHLAEVIASYGATPTRCCSRSCSSKPDSSSPRSAWRLAPVRRRHVRALGSLNVWMVVGLLSLAAVLGDTVNYAIGHYSGPRSFTFRGRGSSTRNTEEDACVLREVRRQDHHHRAIRADCPDVRAVCGGHRGDDVPEVPGLQRDWRRRLGVRLRVRRLLLRQPSHRQEQLQPGDYCDRADLDHAAVVEYIRHRRAKPPPRPKPEPRSRRRVSMSRHLPDYRGWMSSWIG